jgi:hypothetical protein
MSYDDIVICIGSLPILETWPPIYRGQERTVRDKLKASQVYTHVYFRYTPCLTDFTFEFIRHPISLIRSPSSRTFVELTLVTISGTTRRNLKRKLAGRYRLMCKETTISWIHQRPNKHVTRPNKINTTMTQRTGKLQLLQHVGPLIPTCCSS